MIVCICHGINERQIEKALDNGATTIESLSAELGIGTCCGCCRETCTQMISDRKCNASGHRVFDLIAA